MKRRTQKGQTADLTSMTKKNALNLGGHLEKILLTCWYWRGQEEIRCYIQWSYTWAHIFLLWGIFRWHFTKQCFASWFIYHYLFHFGYKTENRHIFPRKKKIADFAGLLCLTMARAPLDSSCENRALWSTGPSGQIRTKQPDHLQLVCWGRD